MYLQVKSRQSHQGYTYINPHKETSKPAHNHQANDRTKYAEDIFNDQSVDNTDTHHLRKSKPKATRIQQ